MSVTYVVLIESVNVIYRLEYNDCRFSDACEWVAFNPTDKATLLKEVDFSLSSIETNDYMKSETFVKFSVKTI